MSKILNEIETACNLRRLNRQDDAKHLARLVQYTVKELSDEVWESLSPEAQQYIEDCVDVMNARKDGDPLVLPDPPDMVKRTPPKKKYAKEKKPKPKTPKKPKNERDVTNSAGYVVKELMLEHGEDMPLNRIVAILRERGFRYSEQSASCVRMEFRQTLKLLRNKGLNV